MDWVPDGYEVKITALRPNKHGSGRGGQHVGMSPYTMRAELCNDSGKCIAASEIHHSGYGSSQHKVRTALLEMLEYSLETIMRSN